jgi:DNA-binding MarR family transcriptional regulator
MKVVVRKGLKLDLPPVLEFVAAASSGVASSILLPEIERRFSCKRRAAQDALAILIRGGWLERDNDPDDERRKTYHVTPTGEQALQTFDGWRELRLARWRYSTVSTRARRRRTPARLVDAPALRWISLYARNV